MEERVVVLGVASERLFGVGLGLGITAESDECDRGIERDLGTETRDGAEMFEDFDDLLASALLDADECEDTQRLGMVREGLEDLAEMLFGEVELLEQRVAVGEVHVGDVEVVFARLGEAQHLAEHANGRLNLVAVAVLEGELQSGALGCRKGFEDAGREGDRVGELLVAGLNARAIATRDERGDCEGDKGAARRGSKGEFEASGYDERESDEGQIEVVLGEEFVVGNDVADRQHGHAEEEQAEGDDGGPRYGEKTAQPDKPNEGEAC